MSRVTFKFPEEMVERHKPRKEAMGVSWPEYFDGQAPDVEFVTPEEVRQIVREEAEFATPEEVRRIFREELERASHR